MGWRYNRRIKILPGVHLNLGKTGHSWSFGKKGVGSVNYNLKTKKVTNTVDTPIKGLYYRDSAHLGAAKKARESAPTDYTYSQNQSITDDSEQSDGVPTTFWGFLKTVFGVIVSLVKVVWDLFVIACMLGVVGLVLYFIFLIVKAFI